MGRLQTGSTTEHPIAPSMRPSSEVWSRSQSEPSDVRATLPKTGSHYDLAVIAAVQSRALRGPSSTGRACRGDDGVQRRSSAHRCEQTGPLGWRSHMASRRFLCRMGRHEWTQRKSEDGQPLMLGGQALEACRHCDAVRERPWVGGDARWGGRRRRRPGRRGRLTVAWPRGQPV